MKRTYMQPSVEVVNLNGKDAVAENMLNISNRTVASDQQLSREEEELFWDEEQGW